MLNWLFGKRFVAPTPPLRDYWVTMRVRLHEPVPVEFEEPAAGYIRILGVRCTPERLHSVIAQAVTDGTVSWTEGTDWNEISLNQLSRSLRREINPSDDECVWHQSGRIYFPDVHFTG